MSLPITSQVIDHLKSLGFESSSPHIHTNSPGSVYYEFLFAPSVEEKKLKVLFTPNERGNPCLACYMVKSGRRGFSSTLPALVSFQSWDDVLAPSFARHVERVVAQAKEACRLEAEAHARAKENAARAVAVARQLADLLRSLGVSVDVEARNLCGRIGGREASVIVTGSGAYVSFGAHGFVEVGRSVESDLPAVAAKVAAFLAALEAAK